MWHDHSWQPGYDDDNDGDDDDGSIMKIVNVTPLMVTMIMVVNDI